MTYNITAAVIYAAYVLLIVVLVFENGLNMSLLYYSTIYGHLIFFPMIFFPLIIFLLKKPSAELNRFYNEKMTHANIAGKRHLYIFIISTTFISLMVVGVDLMKEYYSPWEVSLNKKALSEVVIYDESGLFKEKNSDEGKVWVTENNWPGMFVYLIDAGKIVNDLISLKTNDWQKYLEQHTKDRKKLSKILKVDFKSTYYEKSVSGYVYYLAVFSMAFASIYSLFVVSCYLFIHIYLDTEDVAIDEYNIKENFLKLTFVAFCFSVWFAIRVSFLEIQERFLDDVSKAQEVGPFLIFSTALIFICVFWFIKYKQIVLSVLSAILTISGMLLAIFQPELLADIFTSIMTYVVMVIFVVLIFLLIYFNKIFRDKLKPRNGKKSQN